MSTPKRTLPIEQLPRLELRLMTYVEAEQMQRSQLLPPGFPHYEPSAAEIEALRLALRHDREKT